MSLFQEFFGNPRKEARHANQARPDAGQSSTKVSGEGNKFQGFCESCFSQTRPYCSGPTTTVNGCGKRLFGNDERCPTCQSVVQRLYLCFLWIPLIPSGRFRVKYLDPKTYFSRQLLDTNISPEGLAKLRAEDEAALNDFYAVELFDQARGLERRREFADALNAYEFVTKQFPQSHMANDAHQAFKRVQARIADASVTRRPR